MNDTPDQPKDLPPLHQQPLLRPRLHIKRMSVRMGTRLLELRGPVVLETGRAYLITGASGAGKSSFARALLGLDSLVEPPLRAMGEAVIEDAFHPERCVQVLGTDGYHQPARDYMAFLPQAGSHGFIDELGPMTNAMLFSRMGGVDGRLAVEKLASRLRLWPLPSSLARASGGERVRLAAVRALLQRSDSDNPPAVLVADEPTAGLDEAAAIVLAKALTEVAAQERTITLIVTHEPGMFVAREALDRLPAAAAGVHLIACDIGPDGLIPTGEIGHLVASESPRRWPALDKFGRDALGLIDAIGAVALSPLAFMRGVAGLRALTLRVAARDVLAMMLNPGTWAFVCGASLLVAMTFAIFIFQYFPKRELIEPLLLEKILPGFGTVLVLMLLPMFAAVFTAAKNGAAQSARLASSVRSGLLDTLALARISGESYALAPMVIGHTLTLAVTTAMSCVLGLIVAGMVFLGGGTPMSLDVAVAYMRSGVDGHSNWFAWLMAKTLVSGFAAGTLTAYFGLRPVSSERDVALAVHRTLLWGMFAVLAVQCIFVIAQFGK